MRAKNRKDKINRVKRLAGGNIYDSLPWILIIQKDGNNYISDGQNIGQELTGTELDRIKCPKIFIDEQDLEL